MSWFLCICFTILVVCVVIQTIMIYSEKNSNNDFDRFIKDYCKDQYIKLNDKSNSFVCIDFITGFSILDENSEDLLFKSYEFDKNKFYLKISTPYYFYLEEYDTMNEAENRLTYLLDIVNRYE